MKDIIESWIVLLFVAVLSFGIGILMGAQAHESLMKDRCAQMQMFVLRDIVYSCKLAAKQ